MDIRLLDELPPVNELSAYAWVLDAMCMLDGHTLYGHACHELLFPPNCTTWLVACVEGLAEAQEHEATGAGPGRAE